jgi:hypothetical protein
MSKVSFGDLGGAQALVVGFADPTPALELARDGLLVNAVVPKPGTVRRWRSAARDALPAPALERLSVIAGTPSALEAPPEVYARILIGPGLTWSELDDAGGWLAHLLSPLGQLTLVAAPGADPVRTLCQLVAPIVGECRLVAIEHDERYLTVRAQRAELDRRAEADLGRAFAALAFEDAARVAELHQLIAGLREALAARDRLVLEQRARPAAIEEEKRSEIAALGPRMDGLAERIANARRAVRDEHDQLAAMLASVDELLAQYSRPAPVG